MADAAGEEVDNEINLEQLKLLKEIFEAADEDGSGELDVEEFCAKLGPHLGVNLKPQQVAQLFMKIDADAGGTVDWDEFTNFMFLERAQAGGDVGDADNWRLFPADFRDGNVKASSSSMHHEQVDKVYYCAAIDKYITCARDGTFRLWQAGDLDYVKTVNNGSSWITDCLFLPYSRKMVFTTMDRAITYYDITRGSYDLIGRVYASGAMGVPLALHVLSGDAGERVVYGDSRGAAVLLLCGSRELPARDLISTDIHKDYIYLHKEHSDWITKIQWIPELGLVTSSLDATIKTFDINRERITHTCTHHTKGVHSFVWCHAYSCFASCGLERDVTVWHGTSGRKIGELRGHTSSVSHIALDPAHNHIFTLSIDKSIKVWDLRNHRCLQTITEDDWIRQSDSSPTCMMYDTTRCRLVTACHRPYVWQHKVITQDRTGHKDPVRGALYNSAFAVVVSVDEGGTTCVWNLQDGAREGRFNAQAGVHHSNTNMTAGGKDSAGAAAADGCGGVGAACGACASSSNCVTAISFDKNQRRLVMATNSGAVTVWNFNNGSLLRRFAHDQEALEVCEVLLAFDEKRGGDVVYAAGWNAKVFVWEDQDEDVVESYKTLEGHKSDVLAMAAYAPRQLLASGDYQGRINIWGLFTGERKSWVTYRSDFAQGGNSWCSPSLTGSTGKKGGKVDLGLYSGCGASTTECSVERLLWIPAFSPQQRQASAAAAAALTASAASLTAVGSIASSSFLAGLTAPNTARGGGVGVGGSGGGAHVTAQQQPQQHAGGLNISLSTSDSLTSDLSAATLQQAPSQSQQQQQQQHPQQHSRHPSTLAAVEPLLSFSTAASLRQQQYQQQQQQAAECAGVEGDGEQQQVEQPDALLLLATGGDGGVLLWHVDRLAQVSALCSLPGAVGVREVVTATGLDEGATVVVLGDSTGHLRVLDISGGIDTSSPEAAAASFKQRAHWQAHDGAIASVDLIPAGAAAALVGSCSAADCGNGGGASVADNATASGSNSSTTGAATTSNTATASSSSSSSQQVLILTGSRDCNVAVWTLDGGLVGVLGEHSWDLDNSGTWQDPQGLHKRPPRQTQAGGGQEEEDAEEDEGAELFGEACSSRGGSSRRLGFSSSSKGASSLSRAAAAGGGGIGSLHNSGSRSRAKPTASFASRLAASMKAKSGGSSGGGIPAHRSPVKQQQPASSSQQQQQQQQQSVAAEFGGLSLASLVMQERKQKQRDAMVTTQPQPHCQLRVHELVDVDKAAGLGLHKQLAGSGSSGDSRHRLSPQQQQHKSHSVASTGSRASVAGGGSRHLGSRPSGASSSWSGWTGN